MAVTKQDIAWGIVASIVGVFLGTYLAIRFAAWALETVMGAMMGGLG